MARNDDKAAPSSTGAGATRADESQTSTGAVQQETADQTQEKSGDTSAQEKNSSKVKNAKPAFPSVKYKLKNSSDMNLTVGPVRIKEKSTADFEAKSQETVQIFEKAVKDLNAIHTKLGRGEILVLEKI